MLSRQLLEAFPVSAVEKVVARLAQYETYEPIKAVKHISPHDVLATAWEWERLKGVLEKMDAGKSPPPIEVAGYVLPDESRLYTVHNGLHRAVGARIRGKRRIRAYVSGITRCVPDAYAFDGKQLLAKTEKGLLVLGAYDSEVETCLRFLGVEQIR